MTARELINVAGDTTPFLRELLGVDTWKKCTITTRFMLNGQYLNELLSLKLNAERTAEFLKGATLSRYVGILRVFLEDAALVDLVCDTTDIGRANPPGNSILAIVPFHDAHKEGFVKYARANTRSALVF